VSTGRVRVRDLNSELKKKQVTNSGAADVGGGFEETGNTGQSKTRPAG